MITASLLWSFAVQARLNDAMIKDKKKEQKSKSKDKEKK